MGIKEALLLSSLGFLGRAVLLASFSLCAGPVNSQRTCRSTGNSGWRCCWGWLCTQHLVCFSCVDWPCWEWDVSLLQPQHGWFQCSASLWPKAGLSRPCLAWDLVGWQCSGNKRHFVLHRRYTVIKLGSHEARFTAVLSLFCIAQQHKRPESEQIWSVFPKDCEILLLY